MVRGALSAGYRVTATVRPGKRLPGIEHERLSVGEWDAGAGPLAPRLLEGVSAVCHLAAFYPPDMKASEFAEACLRVNALGTLHLLEAIAGRAIRMVHVSAGQMYRRLGRLATEEDPVWPASRAPFYLSSKLLAELYVDQFVGHRGTRATVLRVGSIYGPGMHDGLVHRFLTKASKGESIELIAGSPYTVDLVYVGDVVQAALSAIDLDRSGVFNIGSGAAATLALVAREAVVACDAPGSLVVEVPATGPPDPGFDALDISRARESLRFAPTALADGLRMTARAMFHAPRSSNLEHTN